LSTDARTRRLRELREHELKCWPEFFQALVTGEKTFELRKDDRGYRYGDVLWLREWRRERIVDGVGIGNYTGREMRRTVTYVLSGFGLQPDFVCLGLAVLDTEGDQPAKLPCGCYIAQCPTHRSQPPALPDPPVQP
jgi:hypothetical protein